MVDDKKIALRPAVELSYLSRDQQEMLLDTMQLQDCTPGHAQTIKMRKFAEEGRLNEDVILSIMSEEKGNPKEQFRIPRERINKYFSPGASAKQIEDTIIKELELYRKRGGAGNVKGFPPREKSLHRQESLLSFSPFPHPTPSGLPAHTSRKEKGIAVQ